MTFWKVAPLVAVLLAVLAGTLDGFAEVRSRQAIIAACQ